MEEGGGIILELFYELRLKKLGLYLYCFIIFI